MPFLRMYLIWFATGKSEEICTHRSNLSAYKNPQVGLCEMILYIFLTLRKFQKTLETLLIIPEPDGISDSFSFNVCSISKTAPLFKAYLHS